MIRRLFRNAAHSTADDVLEVWAKAHIPTRLRKHVVDKVENLFKEWAKLKKNKENKAKRSEGLKQKENDWKEGLDDLFDIAHASALEMIAIPEDKEFLVAQREKGRRGKMGSIDMALAKKQAEMQKRQEAFERRKTKEEADKRSREERIILTSSSSEAEDTIDDRDHDEVVRGVPLPTRKRKRRQLNLMDDKLTVSLDVAKLSDRRAAVVITPVLQRLGHDPAEYNVSYSSIRRERIKHRKNIAEGLKADFAPTVPLTIHWDGKLLPDITGKETVDRLPILVSGEGVDQLLSVPKMLSGTGQAAATAVYKASAAWGICDQIKAMGFDTTSVNTGRLNGACILLEQKFQKDLLWLACRHHMLEIMLEAVVINSLGPSKGPEITLFKRFQTNWPYIDQTTYQTMSSEHQIVNELADVSKEMVTFAHDQLIRFQPGDDYRELLELTIIFLGEVPVKGVSFKAPAELHRARWMAKVIYSFKIWMFRGQFRLTASEEKGLKQICIFAVRLYIRAWFTAPSAPRHDLQLLKHIHSYPNVQISQIALKKFQRHLWYLSEELIALAFFDEEVSHETKHKMVCALETPGTDNPLKRSVVDASTIQLKALEDLVSENTRRFFDITGLPSDFLIKDPSAWEEGIEG